jgi:site-specific DNA-methyltransferase (adenine-specific)
MNIDTKVYRKHENPTFGNTLLGAVPLVSEVYLMDNIELMKHYPDKYFDLAVVDPPYGIDINKAGWIKQKKQNKPHTDKNWDSKIPPLEYFIELFRVSKEQIIWGGNYFTEFLPPSRCFLIWDKVCRMDQADCEMAWCSFDKSARIFTYAKGNESGFAPKLKGTERSGINMHPTQKPIALYDWIFNKFASPDFKILDTHLGSGSSRISANKYKLHFVGCEIDEEYFNKQNKRYEVFVSQARLW